MACSSKPYIQGQQVRNWGLDHWTWKEWSVYVSGYYGIISQVDDAIGKVMRHLQRKNLLDRTLIIYTTDHGDAAGSHRLIEHVQIPGWQIDTLCKDPHGFSMFQTISHALSKAFSFLSFDHFTFLLTFFLICDPMSGRAAPNKSLDLLSQRLVSAFVRMPPDPATVKDLLSRQSPDGSFPDIDYSDTSSINWQPIKHCQRLVTLARAYGSLDDHPDHSQEKEHLRAAIEKGLRFWLKAKPRSKNWWQRQIGIPRSLGPVVLVMKGKVPESLRQKISALAFHGNANLKRTETNKGQNAIDTAASSIYKGVVENKVADIESGFAAIAREIVVTNGSGIQSDGSFHQHWGVLYNGGYGLQFLLGTINWAAAARDTPWTLSHDRIVTLSHLLLDGDRWMIWRHTFDFNTTGRAIARPDIDGRAEPVAWAARQFATLLPERADEAEALAQQIEGGPTQAVGARIFWRSSYAVGRREGGLITINLSENRTPGMESMRQENVLGSWLAHGATFIYHSGKEYNGIFPVWDWLRVPGSTNPQIPKAPERQRAAFAGGVSDGSFGVAAEKLRLPGLKARKAWFFIRDGMVALGAGIGSDASSPVTTSVQQCLLSGPLTVGDPNDERSLQKGDWDLRGPAWVTNAGTGYVLPENAPFHLQAQTQTGSFHRINPGRFPEAKPKISHEIFSLWFDHGKQPQNATYHYAVLPGFDAEQTRNWAKNPPYRVVANTPTCQAIFDSQDHLGLAVFYRPGSVDLAPGLTLATDAPSAVLYRKLENGKTRIAVANPLNTEAKVTITLTRTPQKTDALHSPSPLTSSLVFDLPGTPAEAGRSVIQELPPSGTP